jgi:hypothetical protein
MQDKTVFVLTTTVLFVILAALLGFSGNNYVKAFLALALFIGAVSQYVAQDSDPDAQTFANVAALIGMAFAAVAVIVYVIFAFVG